MNNRLKEIDNFIDSLKINTKDKILKKIDSFFKKYKNELDGYRFISSLEELYDLKPAGYIRYVNMDEEIKYGGILIKVFKSESDEEFQKKNLILIQNSNNKKWVVSWEKNYVFYKEQTKKGDNLRNLFISLIEKKIE